MTWQIPKSSGSSADEAVTESRICLYTCSSTETEKKSFILNVLFRKTNHSELPGSDWQHFDPIESLVRLPVQWLTSVWTNVKPTVRSVVFYCLGRCRVRPLPQTEIILGPYGGKLVGAFALEQGIFVVCWFDPWSSCREFTSFSIDTFFFLSSTVQQLEVLHIHYSRTHVVTTPSGGGGGGPFAPVCVAPSPSPYPGHMRPSDFPPEQHFPYYCAVIVCCVLH